MTVKVEEEIKFALSELNSSRAKLKQQFKVKKTNLVTNLTASTLSYKRGKLDHKSFEEQQNKILTEFGEETELILKNHKENIAPVLARINKVEE